MSLRGGTGFDGEGSNLNWAEDAALLLCVVK